MRAALSVGRLMFGLLTWAAIGIQFARHVGAGFSALNFFSYFTILANGFAGAVLLTGVYIAVTGREPPEWYERARGAAALYMAVVGLVFAVLLRDVDLGGLLPWVNTVHHYVMPIAVVADWLLVPPPSRPTRWDVLTFFALPLLYLGYALVRGAAVGWYPYPFLNPAVVGGYAVVAMFVVGIIATFVAAGWELRWSAARRS
jgi:hypothetical protein